MSETKVGTACARERVPEHLEQLREIARQAISPLKPADGSAVGRLLFTARRTKAGRDLPPYYLVYFLLAEFLEFPHGGKWEKVAWTIPIEFEGNVYLVEHRKLGLGVFSDNPDALEPEAEKIVGLITRGVKVAEPFFRWLADNAVSESKFNVKNHSASLFARYEYLRDQFRNRMSEAKAREQEVQTETSADGSVTGYSFPGYQIKQEAQWVGSAAVDAFFAWTEHVFIHLAIIQRRVTTGRGVAELIEAEWPLKFKKALDLSDKNCKKLYDELVVLRRQMRNYMAHGSFGKQGEAFSFHSNAGAVPVTLADGFSLTGEPAFDEESAIATIEKFIIYFWSGEREPARIYIQDACLPLILTFATDGSYENAMYSTEDMERFVYGLTREMDNAANMDW